MFCPLENSDYIGLINLKISLIVLIVTFLIRDRPFNITGSGSDILYLFLLEIRKRKRIIGVLSIFNHERRRGFNLKR